MHEGGKRPYQVATVLSEASKAATVLPLKSDEMKVAPFQTLPMPERNFSSAVTITKHSHNSGLSKATSFTECSPGSLTLNKTGCEFSNRKKNLLDNIFEKIALDKVDRQHSKRLVDRTLKSITSKFDRFQGGGIYRRQYIDAGSYPVKLKINKADEFDVNIPLNIDVKRVRDTGNVNYVFKDQRLSLCLEKQLFFNHQGTAIPPGYAVVEVEMFIGGCYHFLSRKRNELPRKFLHIGLPIPRQDAPHRYMFHPRYRRFGFMDPLQRSNRSSKFQDRIELIPADVKRDFFEKIQSATSFPWNQHSVHISKVSHGPALTMTLVPFQGSPVKHNINVDITLSLECDIPLSRFGWPREKTKQAFERDVIDEVLNAGIHLVPKKDLFWAISFSKAERALLSRLDTDGGCRKYVTKIMKKFVMNCSSQSTNGLPGISSHIIKTRILWSCEEHSNVPSYWCYYNRDVCLINTLEEFINDLNSRWLPEYFNSGINILQDKDVSVLNTLSSFMRRRQIELLNM
ncbi:uncharacterized protein LOC132717178 isoform X2 [Ruditapes philippinarum]|nr:uncharacterized protein LOC132717178 isoform X2 [Ruditapes philippinarum]